MSVSGAAQLGLGLAGIGLLIEATANSSWPAAFGLGLAAVGSAVYWPLLLAFASRGGDRPGLVVGGLSAAGYVGFLAGPPVVGWVAQATDLRRGPGGTWNRRARRRVHPPTATDVGYTNSF